MSYKPILRGFIMNEKTQIKHAFEIGSICIFTYIANYFLRNLLNVLTPEMIESGHYAEEYLALLASVYMVLYASGQLINGVLGDRIKPKYMVSCGLMVASLALLLFFVHGTGVFGIISFAMLGFGLSMMRGPLVKVISENMQAKHARVSCVFLSFSGFAGPLLAGFAAILMNWSIAFLVAALISFAMAVFIFICLTLFEKKGMVVPLQKKATENRGKKQNLLSLFKLPNFMIYMVVGMVVEIAAASINFWMPTYFNQYLHLSGTTSTLLFSLISLLRALCPFLSLFIFKLFKERDILIVRTAFGTSAALFAILFFVENPIVNVTIFTLALMCSSVSSATLWSIYIPSLGKTGSVSSANGVLDCTGYAAAALLNIAIVPIMDLGGWGGVILSWCATMLVGSLATLFARHQKELT